MLIISMILIFALDIRRGLPVFIVALSFIGWAEIAQYIRSEFLVLRKAPYIEGARAGGLTGLAIAVRHVLPNVLPQLLVISFLEMGAVMMLLGELGFVGVFIGGGSRLLVGDYMGARDVFTLVEVPEWGAILAEGFRYLRSKPFVVFPPAIAFFLSVLGFNALGEGLRRLIERQSLNTAFLLRKRMLLVIAGLSLATVYIINNTGPAPWFARVAQAFRGESAYGHVSALSTMDGRGAGQEGGAEAAAYIAERFETYGLEPGWKRDSYIYPLATQIVRPVTQPYLALIDVNGRPLQEFRHQLDFGFVTDGHGGGGDVTAPLVFVGFESGAGDHDWESFKGMDLRGRVVLLLQGNAPADFATEALIRGAQGVLWITGDGRDEVRSQIQINVPGELGIGRLLSPTIPIYRVRPEAISALLEKSGFGLPDLLVPEGQFTQAGSNWFVKELNATVKMTLELGEPAEVEIPCVLGYLYGSDFDLSSELIILYATYDGLGADPDGTVYPGANHNGSGVGLLLELAQLWQEQSLDARRSVLFVAWGGGELDFSGAQSFFSDSRNYPRLSTRSLYTQFAPAAIVQLDYVGAGGDELAIHPNSNPILAEALEETVTELGITVTREPEAMPPYDQVVPGTRTAWIYFTWSDPESPPDEDALDRIQPEKLQTIGKALALALTRALRQTNF